MFITISESQIICVNKNFLICPSSMPKIIFLSCLVIVLHCWKCDLSVQRKRLCVGCCEFYCGNNLAAEIFRSGFWVTATKRLLNPVLKRFLRISVSGRGDSYFYYKLRSKSIKSIFLLSVETTT